MSSVRPRTLAVMAASFLVVGVVAAAPAPARTEPVARILILPVVVHTAAPDASYVSRGLQDMLAARIEQLGGASVLRGEDPQQATTRLSDAREAGRRAGSDFVLFGAFTQFGDGASLDVQCAAVGGGGSEPTRSIFIQSGTMGEIIPKLDALADKVVRYVGGTPASPAPAAAAGVDPATLADLRRRLEALEQAVFRANAAPGPAQGPAPES